MPTQKQNSVRGKVKAFSTQKPQGQTAVASPETDHDDAHHLADEQPALHPPQSIAAQMLQLQRTIGNRKVSQLIVQRQTSGSTAPTIIQRDATITVGSTGSDVGKAQGRLNHHKSSDPALKEDSIFGPLTLGATKNFQSTHSLKSDGIIGPLTWAELNKPRVVPFKEKYETAIEATPVDVAALKDMIEKASADERKTAWSDAALMTKSFKALGSDDYLTIITKLRMFQAGKTPEDNKTHTSASDADSFIRKHLAAYVAGAVKDGRQIEGHVAVVSGDDWDRAGEAHYGKDVWHKGPPPKSPKKSSINGFVDAKGRVWIEKDSGNAGTMIHEAMHKYSLDTLKDTWGFNFNEGTTEYFTRKVCAALDTPITRANYDSQHLVISKLAGVVTEAKLASAYFDGKLDEVKDAFIEHRKGKGDKDKKAAANWDTFVQHMKDGKYSDAAKLL
jgi:peptidoglycan hydrolase-like protein with peptidoglycan-binding domain